MVDLMHLEEPTYKRRRCQTTDIGVPIDIIAGIEIHTGERCYVYTIVFNTYTVPNRDGFILRDLHCAHCSAIIGYYMPSPLVNCPAANYYIWRNRLYGPACSSDEDEDEEA